MKNIEEKIDQLTTSLWLLSLVALSSIHLSSSTGISLSLVIGYLGLNAFLAVAYIIKLRHKNEVFKEVQSSISKIPEEKIKELEGRLAALEINQGMTRGKF